jgi:hypothetical protein
MSASVERLSFYRVFSHAKMTHNSKYYTKRLTKKDAKRLVCVSDIFKSAPPKPLLEVGDREIDPGTSPAADSVSPVIANATKSFRSVSPVIANDIKSFHASETTTKSESVMNLDVEHAPPPTKILKQSHQYISPAPDQRTFSGLTYAYLHPSTKPGTSMGVHVQVLQTVWEVHCQQSLQNTGCSVGDIPKTETELELKTRKLAL